MTADSPRKVAKFIALCQRVEAAYPDYHRLCNFTRLWNWADYRPNADTYFDLLRKYCPSFYPSGDNPPTLHYFAVGGGA